MHLAEGTIELQVPQLRETLEPFESLWLQAIGKRSTQLPQMIPMCYVKGMSQRDIEAALIDALRVEGTGRSVIRLLFAVLVAASAGWHGVLMPAHITARLQQLAEHPESEQEDPDLLKLAA